jgi:hypothetical protein
MLARLMVALYPHSQTHRAHVIPSFKKVERMRQRVAMGLGLVMVR